MAGALLGSAGALSAIGGPFGILTRNVMLGAALQHTVVAILFSGLLLLVLLLGTGNRKQVVCNPALRFLGFISYGLYLVHLMMFRIYDRFCHRFAEGLLPRDHHFELVVLRFLMGAGAAIALAYVSRIYFENWFLRLKDRMAAAEGASDQGLAVREG